MGCNEKNNLLTGGDDEAPGKTRTTNSIQTRTTKHVFLWGCHIRTAGLPIWPHRHPSSLVRQQGSLYASTTLEFSPATRELTQVSFQGCPSTPSLYASFSNAIQYSFWLWWWCLKCRHSFESIYILKETQTFVKLMFVFHSVCVYVNVSWLFYSPSVPLFLFAFVYLLASLNLLLLY